MKNNILLQTTHHGWRCGGAVQTWPRIHRRQIKETLRDPCGSNCRAVLHEQAAQQARRTAAVIPIKDVRRVKTLRVDVKNQKLIITISPY
jgi:hypothetical protein